MKRSIKLVLLNRRRRILPRRCARSIPRNCKIGLRHKGTDTIVILSDGQPTAGKLQDMRQIADWFYRENRTRMILVHAVAIGHKSPGLKAMAVLSGGKYRER